MVRARRRLTPFGALVKKRLLELDKSQRSLASDIGINEFYLVNILRGSHPGKKHIAKILEVMNISPEEISTEDKN